MGFLIGTAWNPVSGREAFGALPFIFGTLVTSALAIVLAVPVAVGLALLLNEVHRGFAPARVFVDLLAAIPSVVYGLWALFVLKPSSTPRRAVPADTLGKVPVVGALFSGNPKGGDLLTAGVILAIMILPIVTAVSREVIAVVPRDMREGAKASGRRGTRRSAWPSSRTRGAASWARACSASAARSERPSPSRW